MNFLAHLFLAEDRGPFLAGNLMADFVRNADLCRYPGPVVAGIRLHRSIDAFADRHPLFRQSKARISPERRRYAGILIDIFYDHFLARNWSAYSGIPLHRFAAETGRVLFGCFDFLPEGMRAVVARMEQERWLESYAEIGGIERCLARVARRLTRPSPVPSGVEELLAAYAGLQADFDAFFPELQEHAQRVRAELGPGAPEVIAAPAGQHAGGSYY